MRLFQSSVRYFQKLLAVCLLVLGTGCFQSANETGTTPVGLNLPYYPGLFYFASTRISPDNAAGDGDVFFSQIGEGAVPGEIENLTGSSDPGDSDDHLCLLDLARERAFFVSQRTDIGNTNGDLDIFSVPAFGGIISNLTDVASGDGDDYCNAIHAASGDLLFTSDRDDENGESDADIYRAHLSTSEDGAIEAVDIENLTSTEDDVIPSGLIADVFVSLTGDDLLFASERPGPDQFGSTNDNFDQHLFLLNLNSPSAFINLTQQGSSDTPLPSPSPSLDRYCGSIAATNEAGQPYLDRVVFVSDQNVGGNGGEQFTPIVDSSGSFGSIMVPDRDLFFVRVNQPNQIFNLSDAATGDQLEDCLGLVFRDPFDAEQGVAALLSSRREAVGQGNFQAEWSDLINVNHHRNLYLSAIPAGQLSFRIDPISDGDAVPSNASGSGNNSDNFFVGACGSKLFFSSFRDDIEDNPGFDYDLYAVDARFGNSLQIVSMTNSTASGDSLDCFVGCDPTDSAAFVVSARTDLASTGGPVGDTDLYFLKFGASQEEFLSEEPTLTNITDTGAAGDGFDLYGGGSMFGPTCDPFLSIESDVDEFFADLYFPMSHPANELREDDFAFGLTQGPYALFTSSRTNPGNSSTDHDIYALPLPIDFEAAPLADLLVNVTDAGTSEDANDGLEGVITPILFPGGFANGS